MLEGGSLRELVRTEFRDPSGPGSPSSLDRAIDGLRLLGEQVQLARGSSSATTRGVRVEVAAMSIPVRAGGGNYHSADQANVLRTH